MPYAPRVCQALGSQLQVGSHCKAESIASIAPQLHIAMGGSTAKECDVSLSAARMMSCLITSFAERHDRIGKSR
ncbi:hypothetical protein BLAT2472_10339 [Burkholderia latens]